MRYLRIYIVINALMAGVAQASEMAPVEGVSAVEGIAAGEEPPQRVQESGIETSSALDVSQPGAQLSDELQKSSGEISDQSMSLVEQSAPAPQQTQDVSAQDDDAVASEPTIEDAEKEQAQVVTQQGIEIPGMPGRPLFAPTMNPITPGAAAQEPQVETAPELLQQEEPAAGLDTVDLQHPRGNWLFKRYWWDNAQAKYQKIRNDIQKIDDMQLRFLAKRTELDKKILDPFYAEIGISQSDLQRSMQSLMSQLEQEREKQGMLSEEERELMDTVAKDRERLQRLEKDIAAVGVLRDDADRAIDRFMAQKNRVINLDKDAWDYVSEIGRIVNDQEASGLYYKVDSIRKTVKDVNAHVEKDISRFFDQLFTNARDQIERIKSTLHALKEQGIDLKARVHEVQEQDLAKELATVEEDKDKKEATPPQKTGWFSSGSRLFQAAIDVALWQFLQSIWDAIMWLPRRIYSTLSSIFR